MIILKTKEKDRKFDFRLRELETLKKNWRGSGEEASQFLLVGNH